MVDMDNCVCTGRVSGPQGGSASVTGPVRHDQQPFFHLEINHNSTTANKAIHWLASPGPDQHRSRTNFQNSILLSRKRSFL